MQISDFNFKVQEHVKKMLKYAEKLIPKAQWTITINYWQDGDFQITANYGEASTIGHEIYYHDSVGKYTYRAKNQLGSAIAVHRYFTPPVEINL